MTSCIYAEPLLVSWNRKFRIRIVHQIFTDHLSHSYPRCNVGIPRNSMCNLRRTGRQKFLFLSISEFYALVCLSLSMTEKRNGREIPDWTVFFNLNIIRVTGFEYKTFELSYVTLELTIQICHKTLCNFWNLAQQ